MDALSLLCGDAQTFVDKVWASHVHVHHSRREATADADLAGLLRLDDVDGLLTNSGLRTPALRVAKNGAVLPSSQFTRTATLAGVAMPGLVDTRRVLDLFDDGATVVLQGMHRYWPPLTDLVRDLELTLGHPCQANAYLTPPGSRGFALHSDSHDVFVFQTHGTKQWEVHDATGVREVLLEPGTSMYLPTGTPHAAQTQETASLHVTVGINQVTWREVVNRVVQAALDRSDLDTPLPAGYPEHVDAFAAELGEMLRRVGDEVLATDARTAASTEVERFLTSRATVVRGGLRDRLAVRELHDRTRLRRRPQSPCVLVPDDDRIRVLLGDRELRVPARLREPLEHIRTHPELRPADLAPWLDARSRAVLLRRLVVEGLLEVVE
ncbi:MAG TPA: cupin domain-containing protein [Nocardioidaceae bacterium]|nr:cupin domain-containing protein [Nocardioidaceae bacterium]